MAAKRKRKRADEPRLDDASNWLTLTMAHRILSERLNGTQFAAVASIRLMHLVKNEDLPCMRESRANPSHREPLDTSFWRDLRTLTAALRSTNTISLTKRPRAIYGWTYYVWQPELERICGKSLLDQRSPTRKRGNTRIDPSRRSRINPASRSGATAATRVAGAAQPRQSEQPEQPKPDQLPQPEQLEPEQLPEQLPKQRKGKGGGQQPLLSDTEIAAGKNHVCRKLDDDDPNWIRRVGKQNAALDVIANVLPRLAATSWQTVLRKIIRPVLKERGLT
jgi:hypothetical protein